MLPIKREKKPMSKAYVCHGSLPYREEARKVITRKKPFSVIKDQVFFHTVELLMPSDLHATLWPRIESRLTQLKYFRVMMYLSDLLEGDFLNNYIKSGNILMLSEGRPGIDNKYMFREGILRLDLPKDIYERTGLQGHLIRSKGRKHMKTRYSIEIDLRAPSMLHGKKGFERIVWAFKNVLSHSVTWLFYDLSDRSDSQGQPIPIMKHHPFPCSISPIELIRTEIMIPSLDALEGSCSSSSSFSSETFADWALETYEWLGLVAMGSPRVKASGKIDPFLCRYQVPGYEGKIDGSGGGSHDKFVEQNQDNLTVLLWKGFIPAFWVQELLIKLTIEYQKHTNQTTNPIIPSSSSTTSPANSKKQLFFALSAHAFRTEAVDQRDGYTILCSDPSSSSSSSSLLAGATKAQNAANASSESNKPENFLQTFDKEKKENGEEMLIDENEDEDEDIDMDEDEVPEDETATATATTTTANGNEKTHTALNYTLWEIVNE